MLPSQKFAVIGDVTNESLDAIMAGLDPQKEDIILSTCGTGCIPIALAEYAERIDAVDIESHTLTYTQELMELLKGEKFTEFVSRGTYWSPEEGKQRRAYFSRGVQFSGNQPVNSDLRIVMDLLMILGSDEFSLDGGQSEPDYSNCKRLHKIRDNLGRVKLIHGDIKDAMDQNTYTKIFLSNVIGYQDNDFLNAAQMLQSVARSLAAGGLLYSTIGSLTSKHLATATSQGLIQPGTFVLDSQKTKRVATLQSDALRRIEEAGGPKYAWNPQVYMKT